VADTPFKDAEAWLAEQGVERNPLRVPLEPPAVPEPTETSQTPTEAESGSRTEAAEQSAAPDSLPASDAPADATHDAGPPVSARDAARLAQASADEELRRADEVAAARRDAEPRLEDEVADAVAFVRRSTANAPQAEGRLAAKLRDRGHGDVVVEQAIQQCRKARLVDDEAMARALVEEGRRKGHAPLRLRTDLRRRELADEAIEAALASVRDEDPEAAAFALARAKADTLSGVAAETAFRRVVAHLARRGHPEGLARKVAREAVFTAREDERTAGH
jgi:SOS response regulatory protein OraA/RecX